ncbi:MAG: hypothetical protein ACREYC_03140 [Gammaproteobacteria bacterium]
MGKPHHPPGFVQLAAGYLHSCGLRPDRRVQCWGNNRYRQAAPPPGEFLSVVAGGYHTCGVQHTGGLLCWGDVRDGRTP